MRLKVVAQAALDGNSIKPLSAQHRRAIEQEAAEAIDLQWLPAFRRGYDPDEARYGEHATLFLFVAGAFLAGKFFGSFASEAGKDAYAYLRRLISSFSTKQKDNSYNASLVLYIIFDLGDEHLAIRFTVGFTPEWSRLSEEEKREAIDAEIAPKVRILKREWSRLERLVGLRGEGMPPFRMPPRGVHLITFGDGTCDIGPVSLDAVMSGTSPRDFDDELEFRRRLR
jgi:hypothetical protein